MADLDFLQRSAPVQITGDDESFAAKVNSQKELSTIDFLNFSGVNGALTVGTTSVEVRVGGSRLTNRKVVTIYNNSNTTIYWGYSSSVTTANGSPIAKGEFIVLSVGDALGVWLIAGNANNNVRITEAY